MTRVRYFFGQLLTAEAFETEQTYHIEKRRLQNRLLLGAGIVRGLEVTAAQDSGNAIKVSPGIAIDRNGNEIIVQDPFHLGPCSHMSGTCRVIVRYTETPSDPVAAINGGTEFSRITEGFAISIVADDDCELSADAVDLARVIRRNGRWAVESPGLNQSDSLRTPETTE